MFNFKMRIGINNTRRSGCSKPVLISSLLPVTRHTRQGCPAFRRGGKVLSLGCLLLYGLSHQWLGSLPCGMGDGERIVQPVAWRLEPPGQRSAPAFAACRRHQESKLNRVVLECASNGLQKGFEQLAYLMALAFCLDGSSIPAITGNVARAAAADCKADAFNAAV